MRTFAAGSPTGGVDVKIRGPVSAFGDLVVAPMSPRIQIDAVYGIVDTDVQTFTSGTGAAATASGGLFVTTSGTDAGGYGTIRSERIIRYRPGQGFFARFTAMFDAGVASYLGAAGLFTATDGLWFGYLGTAFGLTRRLPGAAEIRTLTITTGATGAGTIAVTLNGASTNVVIGGALSAAATAQAIAATAFTGWYATATSAAVTFLATAVEVKAGAFTFAAGATGSAATGGVVQVVAGAANDQTTHFVAQTAWNLDRMDGTGPSGYTLVPGNLNIYQISVPYLGAGGATFSIVEPVSGQWVDVHRIQYPGAYQVPNAGNPSFRIGWFSASLGSTTSRTVKGASGGGFVAGEVRPFRSPFGYARTATSVSTEAAVLSIRSMRSFKSVTNQRELVPHSISIGVEGTKPCTIRVYLNAALSGTPAWVATGTDSCVEVEPSNALTASGGTLITATAVAGGGTVDIELHELDVRMAPGDTLTITATITGGAGSNVSVGASWEEF